jgi:two-component system nitrogen regulation sensor histidine kinase GlnL
VEIVTRVASEYHLQQPGDRPIPFIVVDISDDGPGIAKEQMEQIFTPFFTTKTQGSGLGLAICQKIISEHQGFLKVDSRPGQKTTFSVSLPFYR